MRAPFRMVTSERASIAAGIRPPTHFPAGPTAARQRDPREERESRQERREDDVPGGGEPPLRRGRLPLGCGPEDLLPKAVHEPRPPAAEPRTPRPERHPRRQQDGEDPEEHAPLPDEGPLQREDGGEAEDERHGLPPAEGARPPPPVQSGDREEVQQVQECPEPGQGPERLRGPSRPEECRDPERDERPGGAGGGPPRGDEGVRSGGAPPAGERHVRPDEGDEHRRADPQARRPCRRRVAQFVDEEEQH
ncbi:MAG: hypothetical protein MUE73_13140, partial [Planctomycetes bacterium]|nr:hypothetical protein [Planctomycetota bacterium]